jgi:hypothetical protein
VPLDTGSFILYTKGMSEYEVAGKKYITFDYNGYGDKIEVGPTEVEIETGGTDSYAVYLNKENLLKVIQTAKKTGLLDSCFCG